MLPRIHLMRHGATEWSETGRHTGRTDVALTAAGEAGARAVGQRLREIQFTQVLSSPRIRAIRTCALAGASNSPIIDEDLREWDYGDYEGLRSVEILRQRPGWNLFRDGCPGGESPDQISARADRVVARLRPLSGNVAIFSHGHFLRALAIRWLALPIEAAQRLYLSTASTSALGFEHESMEEPVVQLWNETAR